MTIRRAMQSGGALHENVREEIRRRIAAGQYPEGDTIPSAAQFIQEFGVSAITVKRALRDLQSSGELTAIPGKGTFVKKNKRFLRELSIGMSSSEDAIRHNTQLSVDLISISREKISDTTLLSFSPPDYLQLCVRKIVRADGIPIMYDVTYISLNTSDEIIEELNSCLISDVLQKHGIGLTDIRLIIDAAPASNAAQQAFSIPSGYPMLRRLYHQTTTRADYTVVGVVESPFDKLACSARLTIGRPPLKEQSP